jgi:hypothetical protein
LLYAESERVVKSFKYESKKWEQRAGKLEAGAKQYQDRWTRGALAFAWKQHKVYMRMAVAAETKWREVQYVKIKKGV